MPKAAFSCNFQLKVSLIFLRPSPFLHYVELFAGNVRFLGGPQIPTIAAGPSMMPSAMAGLIPQKREKSSVPGVTVVPQQLDGPSGSRRRPKVETSFS